jgi:hypothetical protein
VGAPGDQELKKTPFKSEMVKLLAAMSATAALTKGASYTVTVTGHSNAAAFDKTFSFKPIF